tara:strand:+ start:12437 stop:13579 length:1143 start_codon:yes stop_codon:yes gene_type:complete
MFAKATNNVGFAQRVVATLVASAMVLMSIGIYNNAQAANLTNISNTISDSAPSAQPSHSIEFTIPAVGGSAIIGGNNIQITFDAQDDGAGGQDFAGGDISSVISDNSDLTFQVNGGGFSAPTFVASDNDSFTINGIAASAGDTVEIVVASGVITNPSTLGSYEIFVDSASGDSGRTRVAIVDSVEVRAIVDTVFDFTITGLATSTAVNGTSTTGSSSDVLLDFGTLVAGEPEALAQRLNVQTNARNGFVVTVQTDGDLESATGAIIDTFVEGGDQSESDTVWASPSPDVNDPTTWGHWGVTTNDADLNSVGGFYGSEFAANEFIAASTTPREVMHHNNPADNSTANIGQVDVLYQVEITALQEAADDYSTNLTYIATPTF